MSKTILLKRPIIIEGLAEQLEIFAVSVDTNLAGMNFTRRKSEPIVVLQ